VLEELLESDPFRGVKRPKVDKRDMRILKRQEAKRLLGTFDRRKLIETRDYALTALVLATGLRRIEVSRAKVADLDDNSLVVMGKGARSGECRSVMTLPAPCMATCRPATRRRTTCSWDGRASRSAPTPSATAFKFMSNGQG